MRGRKPGSITRPFLERFWTKVAVGGQEECWPWTGATTPQGYGSFRPRSSHGHSVSAHVVAYELMTGEQVPQGFDVHHDCNVRSCCNARHMQSLAKADHGRLSIAQLGERRRAATGEQVGGAKLTWAAVREIRADYAAGRTKADLAREHGVAHKTIRSVVSGRTWKEKR